MNKEPEARKDGTFIWWPRLHSSRELAPYELELTVFKQLRPSRMSGCAAIYRSRLAALVDLDDALKAIEETK